MKYDNHIPNTNKQQQQSQLTIINTLHHHHDAAVAACRCWDCSWWWWWRRMIVMRVRRVRPIGRTKLRPESLTVLHYTTVFSASVEITQQSTHHVLTALYNCIARAFARAAFRVMDLTVASLHCIMRGRPIERKSCV